MCRKIIFCDNNLKFLLNFRLEVMEHFHHNGYKIGIVVPQTTITETLAKEVPEYIDIHPVDMNPNSSNPIHDLTYIRQLLRIFRKEKPDIIFTYTIKPNIYATISGKLIGARCIAMVAGLGYAFSGNSVKKKLSRLLYKFGLRNAEKVITLNKNNRDYLVAHKYVNENRCILFEGGEGVNLDKFKFEKNTFEKIRFLMVARILYDKGYPEFVNAAAIVKKRHPEIEFELLGPFAEDSPMGVPASVVENDVKTGKITYLGVTSDVPKFLRRQGVVVVVASNYPEGLNRSLMEACAMGRPCITTNIAGCKEIVDNGVNGYLIAPKDSDALADAMEQFIALSSKAKEEMSIASYRKALSTFDLKNILTKYDNIVN